MELELERIGWNGYEAALETTVCQEETLESIVPDACPDVLRICETEGIICLRDKVVQEGRLTLSGSVRASTPHPYPENAGLCPPRRPRPKARP